LGHKPDTIFGSLQQWDIRHRNSRTAQSPQRGRDSANYRGSLWSIEIITENLITKEKRVLSFALDDSRTVDQGTFIESFYNEVGATGTPQIVRIRRFDDGGHNAILRATDFDQESDLRASFSYGWRTDLAAATTPAMATYKGFGASEFFLSTPVKNAFGGTADLTADFTNRTISGVLFDNTGDRQDGIVATVTLNNGIINDNGTIAAASANDLTIVMDDNLLPVTSLTMKNSEVLGQFNGVGASSVSGAYGGTMTTTQTGLGTGDITFSGGFRASKQAP